MIDKCLELVNPKGVHLGSGKAYDISMLRTRYGVEYEGGFGFDKLESKMRAGVLESVPEEDVLKLSLGGYVGSFASLKPVGGNADFRCERLSDLKYFLQGGTLLIAENQICLKVDRKLCPDDFAVGVAARSLLTPYSNFIKISDKLDGILDVNQNVLQDSIRVEYVDGLDVYNVIFDLEISLKKPLTQLPYYSMRSPVPVKKTVKFYQILKNFVELPHSMNFLFGKDGEPNAIQVENIEAFQADYTFVRNILHLGSGRMTIHELGSLLGLFIPDTKNQKILTDFFGFWGSSDFYKYSKKHCFDNLENDSPVSLTGLNMSCFFSFKGSISSGNFTARLNRYRNNMVKMLKKLQAYQYEPWQLHEHCDESDCEIIVRVYFNKDKTPKDALTRANYGEHLTCIKDILQKGIQAFDVLLDVISNIPYVIKSSGLFNYPGLKHYLETLVQDTIKMDPLSFCDFGCSDRRCAEIRDYAKMLIGGVA